MVNDVHLIVAVVGHGVALALALSAVITFLAAASECKFFRE